MVRVLPGDPVLAVTGLPGDGDRVTRAAPTRSPAAREDLGLDEPIPVAYFGWLGDLLPPDVDLGFSYIRNTEVSELIGYGHPPHGRC